MKKSLFKIFFSSFIILIVVQCESPKKQYFSSGKIIYEISYPCLEKNEESLMFLLPKKMIMTFSNNQFKNEFIFPTKSSALGVLNSSFKKKAKLTFRLGNNKKYTEIDSTNIQLLLEDLPEYEKTQFVAKEILFLGKPAKKIKMKSLKNDSIYEITTLNDLKIKNVNWCTPFNKIKDVIVDYSVVQYGMEMHFKAISINNFSVEEDFLELDKDYKFNIIKDYLKEIKTMLSIFSCND